ncbi:hypothetical protein NITUZ_140180 [Candidatus Nitrosotenuis uzonensis]|uniref:Uncharacterized protein n=1 Tax=Candidatus Nitrosotenuis uzonensis TaxID=1407055 RepID=V6ARD6_9ARCH|nr:hypothetical protein NITUZ_140180 [Candidatus Nitrosotenuis uzonensis]
MMSVGLTLFRSLQLIGFKKNADGQIRRGNVSVSLRIDGWEHWYVTTPFGLKDYKSQQQALHALTGYRLVTYEDLEKMAKSGYIPAEKELDRYIDTMESYSKKITADARKKSV